MNSKLFFATLFCIVVAAAAGKISLASRESPFASCKGSAKYKVTFVNLLTPKLFGKLIPKDGLNYSPMVATGHSNRYSVLTIRARASREVEQIAETGVNTKLVRRLRRLVRKNQGVKSYAAASGPTMPGSSTTLTVRVDCEHPFITAISMIAPSPDWIVQINNFNVFRDGKFIHRASGALIAYDGGVDDGREFTDPSDTSLDIPTEPQLNIAPLVEDDTDRFEGRDLGKYIIERVY